MRVRAVILRCIPVLLGAGLFAVASGPAVSGEGIPTAEGDRAAKVKRLFKVMGYEEKIRAFAKSRVAYSLGVDAAQAEAVVAKMSWDAIHAPFLKAMDARVGDKGIDEALSLLEGPDATKARALAALAGNLRGLDDLLGDRYRFSDGEEDRAVEHELDVAVDAAMERAMPESGAISNERAAIRALRNIASCQAQIQTAGYIDVDEDGIGEYGTLMELAAVTPMRTAPTSGPSPTSDFSSAGGRARMPIIAPAFGAVDGNGVLAKGGYCYRVFLPDSAKSTGTGFVHETGPAAKAGMAGGTRKVGVDLAEVQWCAYAWPEKRGATGNRVFFIDQRGDVRVSTGETAKWSGPEMAPGGNSAFTGKTFKPEETADGKKGSDGDLWKIVE